MSARKEYQQELETLHDELMTMGNHCIEAVRLSVEAVTTGNANLAKSASETDEIVDKQEKDIESLCLRLLLKQQPVAGDLRRISAALKMISDLERIGDQSADIAEISGYTVIRGGTEYDDLRSMADEVIKMVSESIHAFIRNDLDLAKDVISWDDKADEWFLRIKDDLVASIISDSSQAEYALDFLMVAKYLERIGDHATNVAEWVEYSILGYHPESDEEK